MCGTRFTENSKYVEATFLGGLLTQLKVKSINFVASTKVLKFDDLPKATINWIKLTFGNKIFAFDYDMQIPFGIFQLRSQ